MLKKYLLSLALSLAALPATALDFLDVDQVKPILVDVIKDDWVAVRVYNGQDFVYFTPVLSWRCVLESLHYGLNGQEPATEFKMEPCYPEFSNANVFQQDQFLKHINAPEGAVQTVTMRLTFKDGSTADGTFARSDVFTP